MKKRTSIPRRFLARPNDENWELWVFVEGRNPECVNTAKHCHDLDLPPETQVCLPGVQVYSLPLWLPLLPPEEVKETVLLQLESRGIGSAGLEAWDYSVLQEDEQRQLLIAWALPAMPPALTELDLIERCVPSAFALPLADNACTIWRELDHWTCAIMSAGKIVASQSLGAEDLGLELSSEIEALLVQLALEGTTPEQIKDIVVLDGSPAKEEASNPDWKFENFPSPQWPESAPQLLPAIFSHRKEQRNQRRFVKRLGIGILSAVGIAVMAFLGNTAWLWLHYHELSGRLAQLRPKAERIRSAAANWNALAGAVDPDQSAVELLYRCSRHLSTGGVRFTLFQLKDSSILLVGEGDDVSGVVDLQNQLANDKELVDYQWKMPPPHILPNNIARFEISGDRISNGSAQNK